MKRGDLGGLGADRGEPLPGVGALDGEDGPLGGDVGGRHVGRARGGGLLGQCCGDPRRVRRVRHDVEGLLVEPPHDDVVEHRGIGRVEQVGVLGPAGSDPTEVVGEGPLEGGERTRTADPDGAEVGDVEDHGPVAAGPVLGQACRPDRRAASPIPRTGPCAASRERWTASSGERRSAVTFGDPSLCRTATRVVRWWRQRTEGGEAVEVRGRHLDVVTRRTPPTQQVGGEAPGERSRPEEVAVERTRGHRRAASRGAR